MVNFHTDLAVERREVYRKAKGIENEISGISTEEEKVNEKIQITRVKVLNKTGEDAIGKPIRVIYYH